MSKFRSRVGTMAPLAAAVFLVLPAASGTATTPPMHVGDLRWLGFGKDVVGPQADRPNGERDGHFSVVVAAPGGARAITSISVWICFTPRGGIPSAAGKCDLYPYASTTAAPGIGPRVIRTGMVTVLGVSHAGRQVHLDARRQSSWLRLPASAQGVRLDLAVNDGPGCYDGRDAPAALSCRDRLDHRFAAGLVFRVKVTSSPGGTVTSEPVRLPGQQQNAKRVLALGNFRYLGRDRDVAGATKGSPPDGQPEAHFTLDFSAALGPARLWGVSLQRSEKGGWTTATAHGGSLVVFLDGKRLDLPCAVWEQCIQFRWSSTAHHLDLYADDVGARSMPPWDQFAPGSRFNALLLAGAPNWAGPSAGQSWSAWLTLPPP